MKDNKYIIGGGVLADGMAVFIEDGAVLIENGKISKVGKREELIKKDIRFFDVGGRIMLPGFLNPHHHLYSSFAPGLSPVGETGSFVKILENLWWKLDLALDEESTYYSALMGIIDSIKHGTTMLFDHHASMNYVRGSLSSIEKAFDLAGIKGMLCFETSNRRGEKQAEKHIEENISFFEKHRGSFCLQGMMGLHANFTLDEVLLEKIQKIKPGDMPVHIHCGEDKADFDYCIERGYEGPVDRLNSFNLLDSKSILAHAIHLGERDFELINKLDPVIVTNPESNANNRVGTMNRKAFKNYIAGTDGMSGDMVKTLRTLYLLGEGEESFEELSRAFFSNRVRVQKKYFPGTGSFEEGSQADIAVLDYVPLSPIDKSNITGHLIFGAEGGKVYATISAGKMLYVDGKITFLEEKEVIKMAKKVARKLHDRYYRRGTEQ